jgi:peptide/nickel transport system permease protein
MLNSWFSLIFGRFKTRRQHGSPRRTLFVLGVILCVAIFGSWLANNPKKSFFPPLIPYSAKTFDTVNSPFFSPFSKQNTSSAYYRHWFGTDNVGRDVAAGLISGTQTALLIGVCGVFLALFIGLPIGLAAGFYGDNRLEMTFLGFILRGCLYVLLFFYFFIFFNLQESALWILVKLISLLFFTHLIISILEKYLFKKIPILNKKIIVPLDLIVMRVVEVMQGIPLILWILAALTIIDKLNVTSLILLIGAVGWVGFVRIVRGEMIRIRQLEYMEAAEVIGASATRIIMRHALPNILTPVLIAFSFGISNAILLEAFLSFMGIGLPPEEVTWGTLLLESRRNISYWWMAVFPGLAIFLTVYTFNRLGEILTE